jgi:hypothetical protein
MLVTGRVLSIHDVSDLTTIRPERFLERSKGLTESKVKMLREGRGHGLLYQPYYSWMSEVVSWTGIQKSNKKEK